MVETVCEIGNSCYFLNFICKIIIENVVHGILIRAT